MSQPSPVRTDEYSAMRQRIIDATRPLVARRERGDKYAIGDNALDFLKLEEVVKHDPDKSLWAFAVECGMQQPKLIYEYADTAEVFLPPMRNTITQYMPSLFWSHERNIARFVKDQRKKGVHNDAESVLEFARRINDNGVRANDVGKFLQKVADNSPEVWVQQRKYFPSEYRKMVESGAPGFVDVVVRIPADKAADMGEALTAKDARVVVSVSYVVKAESE